MVATVALRLKKPLDLKTVSKHWRRIAGKVRSSKPVNTLESLKFSHNVFFKSKPVNKALEYLQNRGASLTNEDEVIAWQKALAQVEITPDELPAQSISITIKKDHRGAYLDAIDMELPCIKTCQKDVENERFKPIESSAECVVLNHICKPIPFARFHWLSGYRLGESTETRSYRIESMILNTKLELNRYLVYSDRQSDSESPILEFVTGEVTRSPNKSYH